MSTTGIPVEHYPQPVCRYVATDGEPRVQTVNSSFETAFDAVPTETSVTALFASLGLNPQCETLAASLSAGDAFVVETTCQDINRPNRYTVQPVPPTDGQGGYLLFTPIPERQDDRSLAIDHVASVISHDLRNPLDVAKARLEAGRELGDDHHFEHVAQAHERMERIIQDVLTLSRGEDVVCPDEEISLEVVASSAWETVETNDATLRIEESLPDAIVDPDRVGRLFENLFRNAVEHTPGEVTITVGPLPNETGVYVADDGPGISPHERDRVFEPGYSSDAHGTGLGLAIVARIAALHHWELAVTDSETGGARFEITLAEE